MTDYAKEFEFEAIEGDEDGFVLNIRDLKVYFELRKRGFQHAGFVRAVDGVDLTCAVAKRLPLLVIWLR